MARFLNHGEYIDRWNKLQNGTPGFRLYYEFDKLEALEKLEKLGQQSRDEQEISDSMSKCGINGIITSSEILATGERVIKGLDLLSISIVRVDAYTNEFRRKVQEAIDNKTVIQEEKDGQIIVRLADEEI